MKIKRFLPTARFKTTKPSLCGWVCWATMTNGQVNLLHEKHLKLERNDAGRVHISVTRVTGNVLILAQD